MIRTYFPTTRNLRPNSPGVIVASRVGVAESERADIERDSTHEVDGQLAIFESLKFECGEEAGPDHSAFWPVQLI